MKHTKGTVILSQSNYTRIIILNDYSLTLMTFFLVKSLHTQHQWYITVQLNVLRRIIIFIRTSRKNQYVLNF